MPARFRLAVLALAVLGGCANDPAPASPPVVTAPVPIVYTCDEQRRAAAELQILGPASVTGRMIGDYLSDRRQSRRALGLPDPAPCPPAPAS